MQVSTRHRIPVRTAPKRSARPIGSHGTRTASLSAYTSLRVRPLENGASFTLHTSGQSANHRRPAPPRAAAAMPSGAARPLRTALPQPLPKHRRTARGRAQGATGRHGTATAPARRSPSGRAPTPSVLSVTREDGREPQFLCFIAACAAILTLTAFIPRMFLETLVFQIFPCNNALFSILFMAFRTVPSLPYQAAALDDS